MKTFELPRLTLVACLAVGLFTWSSCGSDTADATADAADEAATMVEEGGEAAGDAADAALDAATDGADGATASADSAGGALTFAEGSWGWNIYNYMESGSGSQSFNLDAIPLGDDDNEEVSAAGKQQLDDLAAILKQYPDMRCEVQGHTKKAKNPVGAKTKQAWSGLKAKWVKEKLKARGVSGDQIDAKGYGDKMLLEGVEGDDAAQRRVVVVFTK